LKITDDTVIHFGRYRKNTIFAIWCYDPDYLENLASKMDNGKTKDALVEWLTTIRARDIKKRWKQEITDNTVFNFGKFKGFTYGEVYKRRPDYLSWILVEGTFKLAYKVQLSSYMKRKGLDEFEESGKEKSIVTMMEEKGNL